MPAPIRNFVLAGRRRTAGQHLRLMLDMQGEIFAPYPTHIFWDMQSILPLYGDLSDDHAYRTLVKHVAGSYAVALEPWDAPMPDPRVLFARLADLPVRNVHAVTCEVLQAAAVLQGARVTIDKSPDTVADWAALMAARPDTKWLHMVRHPLDQVASMTQAIIYPHDPLLNAQILKEAYEAEAALSRAYPDRMLTLSYEAFMEDAWGAICRVCDFMEVRPTPRMLEAHTSAKAVAFAKRSDLWKANCQAPDTTNIGKGRQRLSEGQIGEIESLLAPYMTQHGYGLATSADAAIAPARWTQAREASATEGARKWAALAQTSPDEYAVRQRRIGYFDSCRNELGALKAA